MSDYCLREACQEDLPSLLDLYVHLKNPPTCPDERIRAIWGRILADSNQRVLLCCKEGRPVSTCVVILVENLTHGQRPYMLIENVATLPEHRGRGCASALLGWARDLAVAAGCYKIMLMTGSKEEATLRFYRNAGYNSADKTAFIQWLK